MRDTSQNDVSKGNGNSGFPVQRHYDSLDSKPKASLWMTILMVLITVLLAVILYWAVNTV